MAETTALPNNVTPIREREMPPEHQRILKLVREAMDQAETVHKAYRDRWNIYYGLYRNYRKFVTTYGQAESDRDRSGHMEDARREWGAELFIPYVFATIETVVPRLLSNNPNMIVRPRRTHARDSARRVQELINEQQREIDYDLKLQPTARRGLKYGLGVQKTFWKKEARKVQRIVPGIKEPQVVEQEVVQREGPYAEDVDIWDFFWDPTASNIETADWVIHRTWRSMAYIREKVESGEWLPVDLKEIEEMGSETVMAEQWADRREAAGLDRQAIRHDKMHEVLEYHNGEHVYAVLDQRMVVQNDTHPLFHREIPFQIFRPMMQEGEFCGIGVIEPISHLQSELNQMRSQRRDNASLVVQKPFVYAQGRVRPEDLVFGPGMGIPVLGDPSRDIVPLDFPELPASSYQEEARIVADIERTTGISDPVAGGEGSGGASETATGVQLIQQAANVRIQLMVKNMEAELIRHGARQWLELDRQFMREAVALQVEDPTNPEGYRFIDVSPDDLLADIHYPIPDGGSTQPDNPAERTQQAIQLFNQFANNPAVDQRRLVLHTLKEMDIRDAEAFLTPDRPMLDPALMGKALQGLGVQEGVALEAIQMTMQAQQEAEEDEAESSAPGPIEP